MLECEVMPSRVRSCPSPGLWARIAATIIVACSLRISGAAQPAATRDEAPSPTAVAYGPTITVRYRFGAKIVAAGAPVANAKIVMAVPLECPEQHVTLLSEDATPRIATIAKRQVDEGVQQIVITIRGLAAGAEAHAYATYVVATSTVLAPSETSSLSAPKKPNAALRRYLKPSPLIDVGKPAIRAAVDSALKGVASGDGDDASAWDRVAALYDFAQGNVAYELGDDKSAVQALADGRGDCQAIAATFVAMCRTYGVPARMVWVDGHQYAEFYLESAPGMGGWYPVESAGSRSFGAMPLARVILQKGDAIRVPEQRGKLLRYASDFAVFPTPPAAAPAITFVRERLDAAAHPVPSPPAGFDAGAGSASASPSAASSAASRP
jgi:hypothetical protein